MVSFAIGCTGVLTLHPGQTFCRMVWKPGVTMTGCNMGIEATYSIYSPEFWWCYIIYTYTFLGNMMISHDLSKKNCRLIWHISCLPIELDVDEMGWDGSDHCLHVLGLLWHTTWLTWFFYISTPNSVWALGQACYHLQASPVPFRNGSNDYFRNCAKMTFYKALSPTPLICALERPSEDIDVMNWESDAKSLWTRFFPMACQTWVVESNMCVFWAPQKHP